MNHHAPTFDTSHVVALAGSTGMGALIGERVTAGAVAFFFSLLAMAAAEILRPWLQRLARRWAPPPEPELAARPTVAPPPPPAS